MSEEIEIPLDGDYVEKPPLETRRAEFDFEARQIQIDYENKRRELQQKYVRKLYRLIRCWLCVIAFVLITKGFSSKFHLDNSILITLITSTTATVLGLFVIVAKWLYVERKAES